MITSMLLAGLWQGVPIVAIALLLAHFIPRRNAATRHALWFATLLALLFIPPLTVASNAGADLVAALRLHSTATAHNVTLLPYGSAAQHAGAWLARSALWIFTLWVAGAAINLLRLLLSFARIDRIRRNAMPLSDSDPDLFVSEDVAVPIVVGIFVPSIVVPKALLAALTPADLQRIIAHERAHIRRRDTLSNLLQRLIEACLFFNPWVRIAGSYITKEREAACDDWVVAQSGKAEEYALCLATLASKSILTHAPLLTPSAFGSRHALVARIERLGLNGPRRLTVNPNVIGGTVMLFVILTLVLQAFAPALALTPAAYSGGDSTITGSTLAAACANPNAEASVVTAAAPELPHGFTTSGEVNVAVTIAGNGQVTHTSIIRSSGNAAIDAAVLSAARRSTYSPKIVNCHPVQGGYVFHVEFKPD